MARLYQNGKLIWGLIQTLGDGGERLDCTETGNLYAKKTSKI